MIRRLCADQRSPPRNRIRIHWAGIHGNGQLAIIASSLDDPDVIISMHPGSSTGGAGLVMKPDLHRCGT
jgi:hypothetical protein